MKLETDFIKFLEIATRYKQTGDTLIFLRWRKSGSEIFRRVEKYKFRRQFR